MKSLKAQYVLHFLLAWTITAGTLFLLFYFFGAMLQDEIVKARYINSTWEALSEMDMNVLIDAHQIQFSILHFNMDFARKICACELPEFFF